MKRYLSLSPILFLIGYWFLVTSCEKDPWVFDTSRKAGIYMYVTDTIGTEFTQYNDSSWTRATVEVYLLGEPVDYDRPVQFEFVDTASNIELEKDIKYGDVTLKANEVTSKITFWVRRPDETENDEGKCCFSFRIVENEHFVPYMTTQFVSQIWVKHPTKPKWWDANIFGEYSEKSFKVYFKYFNMQKDQKTKNWQRYFDPVYGENMWKVKNMRRWSGEALVFLPYLKEAVLIPMFDNYGDNPEVDVPDWYKELQK